MQFVLGEARELEPPVYDRILEGCRLSDEWRRFAWQVLVVANDNSTGLKYWVWDGSSWIVNGSAYPTSLGSGNVNWVRLVSKPGSNEIAMIVSKSNSYVYGAVWNGDTNSWGNQQTLVTTVSSTAGEAIGVEYIRAGTYAGHAMFVWGKSGDDCYARRWTGSDWDATTANTNLWTTAYWLSLEADPNSGKLALCVTDSGRNTNLRVYSGSAWDSGTSIGTTATANRQTYAIFETKPGHEGDILAFYVDGTYFRYKHMDWNGSSYSWGGADWLSSSSYVEWVNVARTEDGIILAAAKDRDNDLNAWSFDGTSWAHEVELATDMQAYGTSKQDFMITPAVDASRSLSQAHYRWRNDDAGESGANITIDNVSVGSASSGTQITIPHSTSGTNRLMLVAISYGMSYNSPINPSAVTYNGVSLTPPTYSNGMFRYAYTYLYKLVAPPTGTNNVVITFGSALETAFNNVVVGVITFNGVNQTTPLGTANGNASSTGSPTVNVTSAAGDLVFAFASSRTNALTLSTSGATQRWNQSVGSYGQGAGATKPGTEGTVAMTWTNSSTYWSACGVAIKGDTSVGASFALAEDAEHHPAGSCADHHHHADPGCRPFHDCRFPEDTPALQRVDLRDSRCDPDLRLQAGSAVGRVQLRHCSRAVRGHHGAAADYAGELHGQASW